MFSSKLDIQRIQKIELEMLRYFDEVCEKNQLVYYVCGGTLLGAVREAGFIPWDDDIDVMMPRKDYEWLLQHRDEIFNGKYHLYDYRIDKKENNPRRIPALCDKSLKVKVLKGNMEREQYIFLDIFVLDGMPKGVIKRNIHYIFFSIWHLALQLSWYDTTVNQYKTNRTLPGKLAIKFLNRFPFRPKWDSKKLVQKEHDILKNFGWGHSDYVCSLLGPCHKKEILPKYYFSHCVKLQFEDLKVSAPAKYHEILTHYYGNYMIPPTRREEKELHHRIEIIEGK